MRQKTTWFFVCLIFIVFTWGCSKDSPFRNESIAVTYDQLSRVDVQVSDSEEGENDVIMITNHETVSSLREVFEKVEWEQNVKAEMARKEDVKVTLFFVFDENMPEKLEEKYIWFNKNESAILIDRQKHTYGSLQTLYAKQLKEILLSK
jgi:hypothetical protein